MILKFKQLKTIIILPLFFIPLLFQLITGCSKLPVSTVIEEINFEIRDTSGKVTASQVIDSIEYIILETNDSCFIGKIGQVKVTDNFIFIQDLMLNKLFMFSRSGNFLRTIGHRGKGPGEYPLIFSFAIDVSAQYVYIHTIGDRIIKYNINGDFQSEVKIEYCKPFYFTILNHGFLFIVGYPNTIMTEGYSCFAVDTSGTVLLNKFGRKSLSKSTSLIDFKRYSSFYSWSNQLSFWEAEYDTIYHVDSNLNYSARYCLKYESKKAPKVKTRTEFDQRIKEGEFTILSYIELPQTLLFRVIEESALQQYIYFKDSKKLLKNTQSECLGLSNDIDNGPCVEPIGIIRENKAFGIIWPKDIIALHNSRTKNNVNLVIFHGSEITYGSNPIIAIYSLKHE